MVVNHKDNNPFNNKIDNLEIVSQTLNMRKCASHTGNKLQSNNKSGVTGVSIRTVNGKFTGYIASFRNLNGKIVSKYFSACKLGKDNAFNLAVQYRKTQIQNLNIQGAGYG